MTLSLEQPEFDTEQFRTELTQLRDSFGKNSFITHGMGSTPEGNRQKEENAKRDYEKILDFCADTLSRADDKKAVVRLISEEVVNHCYLNGYVLLMRNGEIKFWRDIAVKLAEKASGATGTTSTAQGTGETQEAATQTSAITAEVGAATQEVVQKTGRDFLEAFKKASRNNPILHRKDFMQVGDYIETSRAYAESGFGLKMVEGEHPNRITRVTVTKITPNGPFKDIEVEFNGQRRMVDGSLFYNFGKSPAR